MKKKHNPIPPDMMLVEHWEKSKVTQTRLIKATYKKTTNLANYGKIETNEGESLDKGK